MEHKKFQMDLAGRELKIEVGQMATRAGGSVLLTYGGTTVLATATMDKRARDVDYLPLMVDYEEKFYAAGKIKSGRFMKREGRASDEAILTGRMIDRVLRPLFNQKIRNEIQVILTVLSFDGENDSDVPSLLAASLALGISNIPWNGPVAGFRIGRTTVGEAGPEQDWVLNPTYEAREKSDFDLIAAGREGRINMIEGGAEQVPVEVLLSAIEFAQPQIKNVIQFQKDIIKELNVVKADLALSETDKALVEEVKKWLGDKLEKAIFQPENADRMDDANDLKREMIETLAEKLVESGAEKSEIEAKKRQMDEIFEEEINRIVHDGVLKAPAGQEKRPDGRKLDEVREIKCKVGFLPRTHSSALFERGATQALSTVTLGSPGDEQTIENMRMDAKKPFFHHYNFPPFCVGEVRPMRGPGRRDIGHGALAERALLPLIPEREKFPYTIRLVSEVLTSNGSSSMASVSGSSLALMDAGVPIKSHISGIAMGLMMESPENYKVLTDIQGPEDHHGDMDCKIAGTRAGVTACQMDVKIDGVTVEMLRDVFAGAKKARLHIIGEMEKAISEPRAELSPYAPRILTIRINPEKIGKVIGPGGKMINEIIAETGAKIDIEDDGLVSITAVNGSDGEAALQRVKDLTREAKPGEIFKGKVVKIMDFGAFVEIFPGQDGLVHISEISNERVNRVEDVLSLGQEISVKVKEIDNTGRISLTLRGVNDETR
ncbi:polyribonucleotide nucleotidyltransferase [Patescibacteria group bacterium]|nr:polyribonucleotide nucleotidyltransferase [Patescibacteria group bacterium]MCG2809000.1 polyribonucleotide nucleotidyltransferase [Candidatus Portnoybacteria bacterium]